MTMLSGRSASLRVDGVIRRNDGRRLLMKWEEKADSLADAVDDLRGACACACTSSAMIVIHIQALYGSGICHEVP